MDVTKLPVEHFDFKDLGLEAVRTALQKNLKEFYGEVDVQVNDCPDLTAEPFNLATKGFGAGATEILDIGGPPFLIPLVDRSKVYDLKTLVPTHSGSKNFPDGWYVSGAAAGPWPSQGSNCEMMVNLKLGKDAQVEVNKSKVAHSWVDPDKNGQRDSLKDLEAQETRCALLANLMVSAGITGKVLEIKCRRRIDPATNFTASIRSALNKEFGTEPIGLGGVFLIRQAKSKIHIMQDFTVEPLLSDEEVNKWLHFYEMDPPMLFQSVLVSTDPGLDLRVEHSHGWSLNGKSEGGHYHYDLAADTVEYHGFYAVAQTLKRIDRPVSTHSLGR